MIGARYDRVAIALHWAMALLIAVNLGLGFWMHDAIDVEQTRASAARVYQWHKSIGLLLLMLAVFRLAWRLSCPPVEIQTPRWQRGLARGLHGLLYGLMVLLPLSGWLMVSAQWRGDGPLTVPTYWFGLFEVPHLFGVASAPESLREQIWRGAVSAHEIAVWAMLGLLVGHVSAAFLHTRRAREIRSAAAGESTVLGFRMRWQAAGPMQISAVRLLAWLALFAAVLVGATLTQLDPVAHDDQRSKSAWPPTFDARLPVWDVDRQRSAIRFRGTLNGEAFHGRFEQWDARIGLDTQQPESTNLQARVHTRSASIGVPLHDRTLKEPEWFDVQRHPYAMFEMTALEPVKDQPDHYQLRGQLRIKNQTVPVSTLTLFVSGAKMHINGTVRLDRMALNLGLASDPDGQYVSRYITVDVEVHAQRVTEH